MNEHEALGRKLLGKSDTDFITRKQYDHAQRLRMDERLAALPATNQEMDEAPLIKIDRPVEKLRGVMI